jgi:outer membrane protein, heavy metal efflux system
MSIITTRAVQRTQCVILTLLIALSATPPARATEETRAGYPAASSTPAGLSSTPDSAALKALIAEALEHNREIRAARKEHEAAVQRVAPAGALDDPMLEAGVLNLPSSLSFSREDMTMKMLGLTQRFPYAGKRELRRDVAQKEADSISYAYQETANRVARDIKLAYYDLALAAESTRLTQQNRAVLEQLLKIAEGRYAVGQAAQVDVLKAQTALSRLTEELIKLDREAATYEAELNRLLGRRTSSSVSTANALELREVRLNLSALQEKALVTRPQLIALESLNARSQRSLELARKEQYPDFDVRVSYGQRDNMPDGTRRSDLVSLTVAINLPVWRQAKTTPRIAEALALYERAQSLYEAQRDETTQKLRQQNAVAEQSLRAALLYRSELVPQSQLTGEAALAAYQVNRLEFSPLLDNHMTLLNFEIARAAAIAAYNKAHAEIAYLSGEPPL